jgi:lysophospholipase L1-like esterase
VTALRLVVLGDSIAHGTGATRPADTLGPRLARELEADGHRVAVEVLAVPGATSAGLAAQVRRAVAAPPDLALVVIGANDLTRLVPPDAAAAALGAAVRELRAAGADVLVVPAPDLSAVAWVPPALRQVVASASAALRGRQEAAATAAGARVAEVTATTAAFAAEPGLFSADRLHPSSAGYARIAAALAPALRELARDRGAAAA